MAIGKMKISPEGLQLIKDFEGCRLTSYKCAAGVWTIGYGHTGKDVRIGMNITKSQAEALLLKDLERFEKNVNMFDHIYDFNQNEFDALVSFAFQIGSINQLTANGTRTRKTIADKIPAYCNVNGRFNQGVYNRRLKEKALFTKNAKQAATIENNYFIPDVKAKGPYIKLRSRGEKVKNLQMAMNDLFHSGLDVDGKFGPNTENALKVIQKKAGLTPDGIYGPKTEAYFLKVFKGV